MEYWRCSSSRPRAHRLQGRGDGRDLGDDVDAVAIVVDVSDLAPITVPIPVGGTLSTLGPADRPETRHDRDADPARLHPAQGRLRATPSAHRGPGPRPAAH